MKTGWYICDGTAQFPYRNTQSIQTALSQTWTKWINILVNKYISDMSLYWNVLLYIKYNTISFLFLLLFSFCTQSIQNILTHPLQFRRDSFWTHRKKKAVSAHYSYKTWQNTQTTQREREGGEKERETRNRMKSHQRFFCIAGCCSVCWRFGLVFD